MALNTGNKKEHILKLLKEQKRLSTSRIMGLISANLDYTKKYLEELELEGKIIRQEETTATYWILKEEQDETFE